MFRTRLFVASAVAVAAVLTVAGVPGNASTVPDGSEPGSETSVVQSDTAGWSLGLIGEQRISNLTMVGGTLVGGLSGISYNPETDSYVIISDDRSDNNPARFLTTRR